jgi:hypothetical protein
MLFEDLNAGIYPALLLRSIHLFYSSVEDANTCGAAEWFFEKDVRRSGATSLPLDFRVASIAVIPSVASATKLCLDVMASESDSAVLAAVALQV